MDSYRHRTPPSPFTTPPRCYPARPPYRHPHQYAPSAQHRGANKRPIEGARDANDATTPSPAHRVTSSSLFLGRFLFWGILFLAGEEEKSNEAGNRIEISFFSSFFFKGGKYLIDDSKGEFFFYSKRRGESCVMQKVVVAANGRVCQQQAVQSIGRESTRAPVCHHLQESFLKGEK
jgi:hypothetical protein